MYHYREMPIAGESDASSNTQPNCFGGTKTESASFIKNVILRLQFLSINKFHVKTFTVLVQVL